EHLPEVVVDAEEVERPRDRLEVAGPQRRRRVAERLERVTRILAAHDRVEEPAVEDAVVVARGRALRIGVAGRVRRYEGKGDPDLRIDRRAAQRLGSPAGVKK